MPVVTRRIATRDTKVTKAAMRVDRIPLKDVSRSFPGPPPA